MDMELSRIIRTKALELGYDACGIIKAGAMEDYAAALDQRIERFPDTKKQLEPFYPARNAEDYAWAKSVVICSRWYGKYHIPEHLKSRIGKMYLTDARTAHDSDERRSSRAFKEFLSEDLGFKAKNSSAFGLPGLRWAAMKAGIGVIRKNNFFYNEKGSYIYLEAWLIDKELELIVQPVIKPCPEKCEICIKQCPTASLAEPYAMNYNTCVSCITTWEGWDLPHDPHRHQVGGWIYGCDICQDVCPLNQRAWIEELEFPGLKELSRAISLEQIIAMDYDFLREVMNAKFFYIGKQHVWKWKTNALNAMLNDYQPGYRASIELAGEDEDERVRTMADWVKEQIETLNISPVWPD